MVKLIQSTQELIETRALENRPIGFVPTMGNLHLGHISLLNHALSQYETVYFSIFVNPKQFGPNEDFNRYPRTLEHDLNLIQEAQKHFPKSQVIVYAPKETKEVFPDSADQKIAVTGLSEMLEGKLRPGHFEGVATVVLRLFEITKPSSAYFGLKDYQQYLVIKQMVKDLALPIKIVGMPIIRESEGLALSSRNQYLSPEEKKQSLMLSRTLKKIKTIINHDRTNIPEAINFIQDELSDTNWNYLEIRDSETLSLSVQQSKNITILAVYQLGTTRLLDNVQVELK